MRPYHQSGACTDDLHGHVCIVLHAALIIHSLLMLSLKNRRTNTVPWLIVNGRI